MAQFILSQRKQQAFQEQALEEQHQQNLRLVAEVAQLKAGMAQESGPNQFLVKLREEDDVETFLCNFERTPQRDGWPKPKWASLLAPYSTSPGRPRRPTLT